MPGGKTASAAIARMRRQSARGEAVDCHRDRRFGQFEKTAGDVPIGTLPGHLIDEESELGQAGRFARAMTDDEQRVEGAAGIESSVRREFSAYVGLNRSWIGLSSRDRGCSWAGLAPGCPRQRFRTGVHGPLTRSMRLPWYTGHRRRCGNPSALPPRRAGTDVCRIFLD